MFYASPPLASWATSCPTLAKILSATISTISMSELIWRGRPFLPSFLIRSNFPFLIKMVLSKKFDFFLMKNIDEMLRRNSMHMVLCEPNFGKRTLQPEFITIPPPLYKGPDDEVNFWKKSKVLFRPSARVALSNKRLCPVRRRMGR